VALLNALTKTLALPVEVSYTLPETLDRLGSGFRYQRKDGFHYPLGHGLRSEAVYSAWHQKCADLIDGLRQEGRLYLFALRALLGALRQHVREELFAWPPKFQLPPLADVDDPLLSRLAFFTRYESLLRCHALREGRQEPRAVQAQFGLMLELVADSDREFEVVGEPLLEVEVRTFSSWLLVRDSDAGRRAQLEFKDYASRARLRVGYATAFQGRRSGASVSSSTRASWTTPPTRSSTSWASWTTRAAGCSCGSCAIRRRPVNRTRWPPRSSPPRPGRRPGCN
jgi:hypothetical protein